MKLSRSKNIVRWMLLAAIAVGCSKVKVPGQAKEDDSSSGSTDTNAPPPATGEASTVSMSGTLALAMDSETALRLTAASYNLYCVTFEDAPKACKGDIAADGKFGFACEGFVGRAFGCFFRDGAKTLGTVEFGEDSQVVAGAGNLVFNMVFNPETGTIKAVIDVAASSALSDEALAPFKEFLANNKTEMADLTGNWEIKPDCTKNAEMCPPDMKADEAMAVYMEQYVGADSKTYLAMWSDEAKKNQCGGSANLAFSIGGSPVDFKSKDALWDSLNAAMATMDATLAAKLKTLAIARGNRQYGWCENQQSSPFTADNCKLVKSELETHTWKDENGVDVTQTFPKYYSAAEFDGLTPAVGDGVADVSCSFEWKEGVAGCPQHATKHSDGTGSFKQATSGGVPMLLVCKDPQNGENLMHEPSPGKTIAEAVAVFVNQKPKECEKIAGGTFDGQYRATAQEAARAVLDMSRINPNDGWAKQMCDRYTIAADFTWAKCAGDMQNAPSICWDGQWQRDNLGISIVNGKLEAAIGEIKADWFNADEYLDLCPVAAAAAKANPDKSNTLAATQAGSCRAEILAKTVVQQAQAFAKLSQQWQPLGEILYCDASTQAAATALAASSCTADARLDHQCGPNGCEEVLMCSGSSDGGRCFNDEGLFVGRVSGRDDNMLMKMGIAGSFSMTQSQQDFWRRWDPETNEQQKCVYSRIATMSNMKVDDNQFNGIYSSQSKESCEAEAKEGAALTQTGPEMPPMTDTGEMPPPPDSTGTDGGGGGGEGGGGGDNMTIPFTATRK